MKKIIKSFSFVILLLSMFLVTSCAKSPDKGNVSESSIIALTEGFLDQEYSSYQIEGNFNYFASEKVETEVSRTKEFTDSKAEYSKSCSSYYLEVPLHITKENISNNELGDNGLPINTLYNLKAKIYRDGGFDTVYFYKNTDGGFSAKCFAVNKSLKILYKDYGIEVHAKWNITITYDKNGYLVSEEFSTHGSNENNKENCVFGKATYQFS